MEGMNEWSKYSGTGEQEQEQALMANLERIRASLEFATGSYQTDLLVAKPEVSGVLEAAKKLIEEIDKVSQKA